MKLATLWIVVRRAWPILKFAAEIVDNTFQQHPNNDLEATIAAGIAYAALSHGAQHPEILKMLVALENAAADIPATSNVSTK